MATTREFIDLGDNVFVVETSLDVAMTETSKGEARLSAEVEFDLFNGQGDKLNLDIFAWDEPAKARAEVAGYVKGLRMLASRIRQHAASVEDLVKDA